MIAAPLNDRACLDQITAMAVRGLARPDVQTLAGRFLTTGALASWIRELPQRDDAGDAADGPKVACDVPQRVRVLPGDPNCVERALLYVMVAELLDPGGERQLATIDTPAGRHTLVVEDGEAVLLDPSRTRLELDAGVTAVRNRAASAWPRNGGAMSLDHQQLLHWITRIAADAATSTEGAAGRAKVVNARQLIGNLVSGVPVDAIRKTTAAQPDLAYTLDIAQGVAPLFGPPAVAGVLVARTALGALGLLPGNSNNATKKKEG